MTISSYEIPLAAWSFLLSLIPDFLNSHLTRVPKTPNQEGTKEMRNKVLSSVDAQDKDKNRYQVSDSDDDEFYRDNDLLDV